MPSPTDSARISDSADARTQIVDISRHPWLPITCDELYITCDTLWITCDGGVPVMRPQAKAVLGLSGLQSS